MTEEKISDWKQKGWGLLLVGIGVLFIRYQAGFDWSKDIWLVLGIMLIVDGFLRMGALGRGVSAS